MSTVTATAAPSRCRLHLVVCATTRVVEKSSSNIVYPTLTQSNYTEWSIVMMVNLQAVRLWDVIESSTDDYHDDQSALAALLRVMPQEMQAGLAVKPTTHEACEAI
jgi:hypothetical protein